MIQRRKIAGTDPDTPASVITVLIRILPSTRQKSSGEDPDPGSGAFLTPGSGIIRILPSTRQKSSGEDPDPGSGAFLTPGSGIRMGKTSGSGSGMNNPDLIS